MLRGEIVVDEPQGSSRSLAEEQRELTRWRIRRAAIEVVAQRGFDATVEQIAQASGVSARTIFRHYASHDQLILVTVKDMFAACGRRPIEGLPSPEDDLEGWIDGLALTIHTRNAEILGEAFWDIHTPSRTASAVLREVGSLRRQHRTRGVRLLTMLAWRTAGGVGDPPEDLMFAFALNLSAFTTQALMVDFDRTPAQIGKLTAKILKDLLHHLVETQCTQAAVEKGSVRLSMAF